MERTQHAIDSAASARDACTRELTHVPIEAQLLAGHHIRGGYELAVDCAPNGGHTVPPCVHEAFFHDAVFFTPLHQILSEG